MVICRVNLQTAEGNVGRVSTQRAKLLFIQTRKLVVVFEPIEGSSAPASHYNGMLFCYTNMKKLSKWLWRS